MSHRIVFSPEAQSHLIGIFDYLESEASSVVAERFTNKIIDFCETLQTFPHRGTRRDDIMEGLRTIGFRRRVTIAFVVAETTVSIVGIFYGGQDFEAKFRDTP